MSAACLTVGTLAAVDTHYVKNAPFPSTNHFLGLCAECDAHHLATKTLGEVEQWYWQGQISQIAYEGYMFAWQSSVEGRPVGAYLDDAREYGARILAISRGAA